MGRSAPILVSYSNGDADFVLHLTADLRNLGVDVWMDRFNAGGHGRSNGTPPHRLTDSAALLPILSPDYASSTYCQRELDTFERLERPIIPVMIHPLMNTEWSSNAADFIDFSRWREPQFYQDSLKTLVGVLQTHTPDAIINPPDPMIQHLNDVLATFEADQGIVNRLETALTFSRSARSAEARPQPFLAHGWDMPGNYVTADDSTRYETIEAAAEANPQFVLTGAEGGGKTFALRSLFFKAIHDYLAAPGESAVPLWIDLREWDAATDPVEMIRARWRFEGDPIKGIVDGEIALFLDGLSDTQAQFNGKLEMIRQWLKSGSAPQRVVITCRQADYERVIALDVPAIQLCELERPQVEQIAARYLAGASAEAFLTQLDAAEAGSRASVARAAMIRQPFMLAALLMLYRSAPENDLPASPGALLNAVIETLWKQQYWVSADASLPQKPVELALADLAYAMVDAETSVYDRAANRAQIREALLDAALSAGLLEASSTTLRFSHALVQTYYAARALQRLEWTRRLSPARLNAEQRRHATKWDDAVTMLVALSDEPDAVIDSIAAVDPLLALQAALANGRVSGKTYEDLLQHLLNSPEDMRVAIAEILLGGENERGHELLAAAARYGAWDVREAAVKALSRITDAQGDFVTTLIAPLRQLRSSDRLQRQTAAKALGETGDAAAVPALLGLLDDSERAVAVEAAAALGKIADPAAVPGLIRTFSHGDWRVGRCAIPALIQLSDASVPALIDVLQSDNASSRQKMYAVETLALIDHPDAVAAVVAFSQSDDVDERYAAVAAMKHGKSNLILQRLTACLEDTAQPAWSSKRICDVAANSLENIGTLEATTAVKKWRLNLFKNLRIGKKDRVEKAIAADASSSSTSSKTLKDRLMRVLRTENTAKTEGAAHTIMDFDWITRRDKVLALSSENADTAVPELIKALADEDSQVRIAAVNTLIGFRDDERVIPALLQALRDGEYLVCDAAATALKQSAKAPLAGLVYAIRSPDLNTRSSAIDVAGAIKETEAVPDLIEALSDLRKTWLSKQRICDIAADALQNIGTPEALEAAQNWRAKQVSPLRQSVEGIAGAAARDAQAADNTGENRVVLTDLIETLHADDWGEKQEAAKLLRDYAKLLRGTKDTTIIQRLTDLLSDDDWGIRYTATEALAWVQDKTPVPKIAELVKDANWMIRASALRALMEIGDPRGIDSMLVALADEKSTVREAAAEALGVMGDTRAVGALTTALEDSEDFVRLAAVRALGKIKDKTALPPLRKVLSEPDPVIRWVATDALRKIAHPDAVPNLIPLLEDTSCPHWEEKRICDVAASALAAIDTPEARAALETWKQGPPNY